MPMSQNEINVIGATQFAVGLSQVVRIQPSAFQYSSAIKIGSGGSLEIVKPQLSGSSTGTSLSWGMGYLMGSTEVFAWDGGAAIYLAASGATVTVHQSIGYTAGSTFL